MFSKPIVIDDYTWIATGATPLLGVRIGKSALSGAGVVVGCDVPDYALATGNPATPTLNKRTKNLRRYDPIIFAESYEAWTGRNVSLKIGLSAEASR